jgi:hypothetical protein
MNSFLQACTSIIQEIAPNDSRAMSIMKPLESSNKSSITVGSSAEQSSSHLSAGPKFSSRSDAIKKDWIRFVTFVRLCLIQLLSTDRRI